MQLRKLIWNDDVLRIKKKLVTIRPKPGIVQGDKPQLLRCIRAHAVEWSFVQVY